MITAANSAVSCILLVTLDVKPGSFSVRSIEKVWLLSSAQIPITTDVVWQIFSPYGQITKIVIMTKGNLQALIQYTSQSQCCTAFDTLHDKSVFVGAEPELMQIKLTIQYSHLGDLTIKSDPTILCLR